MKDLSIYFSQFGDQLEINGKKIGGKITVNSQGDFYHPKKNEIAILFVPEYSNSDYEVKKNQINLIRKSFYDLFPGDWSCKITDLGTIQAGESFEDTRLALSEVCSELIKNNVVPLVIGGSQDLTLAIYQAYQSLEQTVNLLDIDCAFDMGDPDQNISEKSWINKILLQKPNYLFNYTLLGYQSYLTDLEELNLLDKLYFDGLRLGDFNANKSLVEPIARNTDILSFDLDAIRGSDYSGNSRRLPHGIYGEDACAIMRYAGLSDKLTCLGLFNLQLGAKAENDAGLIAQMIWYFIEGFSNRKGDYPIGTKKTYTKYLVSIDNFKDEIVFYKSDKSSRWWMEVPYPKVQGARFQRHLMIPCNYEDYQNALTNEMPNLWWKTFEKLS